MPSQADLPSRPPQPPAVLASKTLAFSLGFKGMLGEKKNLPVSGDLRECIQSIQRTIELEEESYYQGWFIKSDM